MSVSKTEDILEQLASPRPMSDMLFDSDIEQEIFQDNEEELSEDNVEIDQEKIISMLSHVPISVDEIVRACHVSVSGVQSVLLDLEVAGRCKDCQETVWAWSMNNRGSMEKDTL